LTVDCYGHADLHALALSAREKRAAAMGALSPQSSWAGDMERDNQQQTVTVDRGLFLVRYAAAEDQEQPPTVKLSADPASNGNVSFVLLPDHDEPILWQPETCLVVRTLAAAKLAVHVQPRRKGGSTAATIRIEPISQGTATASMHASVSNRAAFDLTSFRVLGHLTRVGDVIAKSDEWLAGPSAPARIEGIKLEWPDSPPGVTIRYGVKTARPQPVSGRIMDMGGFAGTRGKAMPIVGATFEISGPAAEKFALSAHAIFLGSPVARATGKRLVLAGPTGREPLVGLRLILQSEQPSARSSPKKARDEPKASNVRGRPALRRTKPKQRARAQMPGARSASRQ
jgi:hypothetical protein